MMNAINSLIAAIVANLSLISPMADCYRDCRVSEGGLDFITHFEGYSPFVYKDAAGYDTIGIGHLIKPGEKFTEPLLPEDAKKLLELDTRFASNAVNKYVKVRIKQNQADAVISWTFNLGAGALQKSTMLKRINAGRHADAANEMERWIRAGGRILRGLIIRREAEAKLYLAVY